MPRKNSSYTGPTPRFLRNALLQTLGEQTGYTAGILVAPRPLYNPALRVAGIDPHNCPWPLEGYKVNAAGKKVFEAGVYHRIGRAFSILLASGLGVRGKNATGQWQWGLSESGVQEAQSFMKDSIDLDVFTNPILHALAEAVLYKTKLPPSEAWKRRVSSLLGDKVSMKDAHKLVNKALPLMEEAGLVLKKQKGYSLTPKGVEQAVAVRELYDERSVTVFWLNGVLGEFYPMMERHLSAKYPRSRQFNEILDLVNEYLTNLMARDGLRKRITAGKHPSASQLCHWACRQACSQFRNEGKDAHTRAFKGALTERDRRHIQSMSEGGPQDLLADTMIVVDTSPIYLQADSEGRQAIHASRGTQNAPLMDICGGDLEDEVSERLAKEYGFKVIERVIRRHKRGAPDRYVKLARAYMLEGSDINDIAKSEGVSRNRAASLVATIRGVLVKAKEEGDLKEIPAIFF